ncbi:DUF1672 family protein [Sporolactobacillus terrae]|uniref:DUF1672 family protein n=1 Tax=Sporolactobacillus terrae TaxID=269673 RepID=UPI000A577D1F|nr:DUF1672 family protein [Sporolactobacillus terrae]
MENDHQGTSSTKKEQEKHYENNFISVQKYTGQGYSLDGGEENDKIAEAHRAEVVKATEQFFLKKYKTKVKVHNLVGNKYGVTVFVESIGEPHFYAHAVVPINDQKVDTDNVISEKGKVEEAIRGGIYAMVYDREFQNLDDYLKRFTKKYPVVGVTKEAEENIGGRGFSTVFYYTTIIDDAISVNVIRMYLEHPDWTKSEWKKALKNAKIDPQYAYVAVQLFMKTPDTNPDKKAFQQLVSVIDKMKDFPPGSYSIYLHDNQIGKRTGRGNQKHMLGRSVPHEIIKY